MSIYRRNTHTGVSMGGSVEKRVYCNRCVYFSKTKEKQKKVKLKRFIIVIKEEEILVVLDCAERLNTKKKNQNWENIVKVNYSQMGV